MLNAAVSRGVHDPSRLTNTMAGTAQLLAAPRLKLLERERGRTREAHHRACVSKTIFALLRQISDLSFIQRCHWCIDDIRRGGWRARKGGPVSKPPEHVLPDCPSMTDPMGNVHGPDTWVSAVHEFYPHLFSSSKQLSSPFDYIWESFEDVPPISPMEVTRAKHKLPVHKSGSDDGFV
eukprot:2223585-Lingulodinium_polyedra.AAC.1